MAATDARPDAIEEDALFALELSSATWSNSVSPGITDLAMPKHKNKLNNKKSINLFIALTCYFFL
ncbi:MAG: hypothetical protein Kow0076_0380 [Francisella sp.]